MTAPTIPLDATGAELRKAIRETIRTRKGTVITDESGVPVAVILVAATNRARAVIEQRDNPVTCHRRNPHTPHGPCPGTAPEYPSETIETVTE